MRPETLSYLVWFFIGKKVFTDRFEVSKDLTIQERRHELYKLLRKKFGMDAEYHSKHLIPEVAEGVNTYAR